MTMDSMLIVFLLMSVQAVAELTMQASPNPLINGKQGKLLCYIPESEVSGDYIDIQNTNGESLDTLGWVFGVETLITSDGFKFKVRTATKDVIEQPDQGTYSCIQNLEHQTLTVDAVEGIYYGENCNRGQPCRTTDASCQEDSKGMHTCKCTGANLYDRDIDSCVYRIPYMADCTDRNGSQLAPCYTKGAECTTRGMVKVPLKCLCEVSQYHETDGDVCKDNVSGAAPSTKGEISLILLAIGQFLATCTYLSYKS